MKINITAWANATALITAAIYVICGLLVSTTPGFMMMVARSWFHGIDLSKSWSGRAFPGNFLFGFVTIVIFAWFSGYVFAWVYNKLAKK